MRHTDDLLEFRHLQACQSSTTRKAKRIGFLLRIGRRYDAVRILRKVKVAHCQHRILAQTYSYHRFTEADYKALVSCIRVQ